MNKILPTRTFHPLPFEHLEPHRFEDLVRQLAYEFRRWKSLEAIGRSGADDGIDIRGIELVGDDSTEDSEEEGRDGSPTIYRERLWIFQCKREKNFAAGKIAKAVEESMRSLEKPPHGFVLAVSCDLSKKSRDAFREEMVKRGIEEFAIWAKGELEDMLFQPKNDRLLFVYFGLSFQARRQSAATALLSVIARKEQLAALLESDNSSRGNLVLLRDPADDRYPKAAKQGEDRHRWLVCRLEDLKIPGHLSVLRHRYLAAVTADRKGWDFVRSFDEEHNRIKGELSSLHAWAVRDKNLREVSEWNFWQEYISEEDRAYLEVSRCVPIERILAIDPKGDGHYPIPHLFVGFEGKNGPFNENVYSSIVAARSDFFGFDISPGEENKVKIFPVPLPQEDDSPPDGFDDTIDVKKSLSSQQAVKIDAVLSLISEKSKRINALREEKHAHPPEVVGKMSAFREWRDKTALPIFSGIVKRLRKDGHKARVVVTSVSSGESNRELREGIELRIGLKGTSEHNPSYCAKGNIKVGMRQYSGFNFYAFPNPNESKDRYSSAPNVTLETLTREYLEAFIVQMIEKVHSGP